MPTTVPTMSQLSGLYLFTYNSLQALGWAVSLFSLLSNFLSTNSIHGAYESTGQLIWLLQICSFLEVIHGVVGIVPSGVLFPFMQWGGRTLFFLSIVRTIDEVQKLPSVFITFIAWSLSEVIRYPFYALNSIGTCPSWITYLRYTAFIVLYPIGLFPGEMWLMYEALPCIKKKNLFADFFGVLPFSYYNFLRVMLVCYPFLWLKLYLHLFKQRGSKLGKNHKKKH
ncbi:very-long-chain (3R)-3-hydroxyacyl-CoA dehydratase 2 [Mangifera indica]|uniref:very-long-chain (3R)-3-hydroxyacyl-CoA dehydratase 2 n=1 Tax=Mangifera indica TaxID=29780 RepID=UPI001CFA8DD4|nr:very-long-chain (3R)-3-hydroxyacyl-CoA dehydratase 2 [Mangifera indica]